MGLRPVRVLKHGTGRAISIPRPILNYLGWQLDELLIAEVTPDNRLVYRRAALSDFQSASIQPFLEPPAEAPKP